MDDNFNQGPQNEAPQNNDQQQYQEPQYQQPQYQQPQYQQPQPAAGDKNKLVAGLLAIFLGTLGIHKFYLGYSKEGIIMLLVSVLGAIAFGIGPGVMAVIALIEGILYLTKSDADFYNIYVANHKGWF